jgi:hypothetical protein
MQLFHYAVIAFLGILLITIGCASDTYEGTNIKKQPTAVPDQCRIESDKPLTCEDFGISGTDIYIVVINDYGENLLDFKINVVDQSGQECSSEASLSSFSAGSQEEFLIGCSNLITDDSSPVRGSIQVSFNSQAGFKEFKNGQIRVTYRQQPSIVTCSDSDGQNYYVKGETREWRGPGKTHKIYWEDGNPESKPSPYNYSIYYDHCDANYVVEAYCLSGWTGRPVITTQTFLCPNGCEDGACIES